MPNYFANLPAPEIRNALIDYSPINSGLDSIRQQGQFKAQNALAQSQETRAQSQFDYQRGRDQEADRVAKIKRGGDMAFAIQNMDDRDPAKAQAWQRYLQSFGDGNHSPEEMDFRTGPKIAAAAAGQYVDQLERRHKQLQVQTLQKGLQAKDYGDVKEVNGSLVHISPDKTSATSIYGGNPGSVPGFKDAKQVADVEEGIRKEVTAASKDFSQVRDGLRRIKVGSTLDTGAGDLAIVYGYMKMLDPTSVVREGEFATAEQTTGVPSYVLNLYNKIVNGERLPAEARTRFLRGAEQLYATHEAQWNQTRGDYEGLATRKGIDPRNVIMDQRSAPDLPPRTDGSQRSRQGQIPPAAVRALQANPGLAADFEAKYGVPASQFMGR